MSTRAIYEHAFPSASIVLRPIALARMSELLTEILSSTRFHVDVEHLLRASAALTFGINLVSQMVAYRELIVE